MNRLYRATWAAEKRWWRRRAFTRPRRAATRACLMAPTEILAAQRRGHAGPPAGAAGHPCGAADGQREGRNEKAGAAGHTAGEVELVVGTHAVLSAGVEFARLGFAVTDEQHRFGVRQRSLLAAKADHPHLLVMSATPIPARWGFLMFGDLDISVLDELPPGRTPVKTYAITGKTRGHVRLCAQAAGRRAAGIHRVPRHRRGEKTTCRPSPPITRT